MEFHTLCTVGAAVASSLSRTYREPLYSAAHFLGHCAVVRVTPPHSSTLMAPECSLSVRHFRASCFTGWLTAGPLPSSAGAVNHSIPHYSPPTPHHRAWSRRMEGRMVRTLHWQQQCTKSKLPHSAIQDPGLSCLRVQPMRLSCLVMNCSEGKDSTNLSQMWTIADLAGQSAARASGGGHEQR